MKKMMIVRTVRKSRFSLLVGIYLVTDFLCNFQTRFSHYQVVWSMYKAGFWCIGYISKVNSRNESYLQNTTFSWQNMHFALTQTTVTRYIILHATVNFSAVRVVKICMCNQEILQCTLQKSAFHSKFFCSARYENLLFTCQHPEVGCRTSTEVPPCTKQKFLPN